MASQLASFLSKSLFLTSKYSLTHEGFGKLILKFENAEIVAANQRVVLMDAFDPEHPGNHFPTELATAVADLRSDPQVKAARLRLLEVYQNRKEALIHNDLHPGNALVGIPTPCGSDSVLSVMGNEEICQLEGIAAQGQLQKAPDSLFVIDWEFATVGPMAYDPGCLLGNLMLAFLAVTSGLQQDTHTGADSLGACNHINSRSIHSDTGEAPEAQQAWLRHSIKTFCEQFKSDLMQLQASSKGINDSCSSNSSKPHAGNINAGGMQRSMDQCLDFDELWRDTLGFAALNMIRLTIGMHHYIGYSTLSNSQQLQCSQWALELARELLLCSKQSRAFDPSAYLLKYQAINPSDCHQS